MIMKCNPTMSWSSLISCLWTSQRAQRWTPKDAPTFFCPMAQRSECILWNIDWCSTVSNQVIFDFDCCNLWRNLDLWLVEQECCEASDWLILTFSAWHDSEITISFSASLSQYSWYSRNPVHYAKRRVLVTIMAVFRVSGVSPWVTQHWFSLLSLFWLFGQVMLRPGQNVSSVSEIGRS